MNARRWPAVLYHLSAAILGRLAFAVLDWPSRFVPWRWRDYTAVVGFWALDHEAAAYELRHSGD